MIKLLFIKYLDPHAHKKGTKPDQTWGFFFIFIKTKIITQSHCSTEEIWDLCMLSIQTDHIKRQSYLSNKSYVCMQILVFWQELYWWKSPHIWRDIQKNVTGKKKWQWLPFSLWWHGPRTLAFGPIHSGRQRGSPGHSPVSTYEEIRVWCLRNRESRLQWDFWTFFEQRA